MHQGRNQERQAKRHGYTQANQPMCINFGISCNGCHPLTKQFSGIVLMQKVQSAQRLADFSPKVGCLINTRCCYPNNEKV